MDLLLSFNYCNKFIKLLNELIYIVCPCGRYTN